MTVSDKVRKAVSEAIPDKLTFEGNVGPVKVGAEYELRKRMGRGRFPTDADLPDGAWWAEHPNARYRPRAERRP